MNKVTARKVVAKQLEFSEKDVYISNVSTTGNTVLAVGGLKVAFVLQKDENNAWHLLKIRHASNRWETPETFRQSVPLPSTPLARALHSAFIAQLDN